MKTSLGIWAFGAMATRFNPGGYKPELVGASTADKVFSVLMGDQVEPRRAFIEANARDVKFLDV